MLILNLYLTLVSKFVNVCLLFISAEFVIMLAGKSKSIEKFKKYLSKNEADFPVSNYV